MDLTRIGQMKKLAKRDPEAAAKLIVVQEKQIDSQKKRIEALKVALALACQVDHIDPFTGEVTRIIQFGSERP